MDVVPFPFLLLLLQAWGGPTWTHSFRDVRVGGDIDSGRSEMRVRVGTVPWLLVRWLPVLLSWRAQSRPHLCH